MSKQRFMEALVRANPSGRPAFGSGTSIVCRELMAKVGSHFPEAHLDAEKMSALAGAGHTVLGLDVVMPLFSVCHEAGALGCDVNWGGPDAMPESGRGIWRGSDDIVIPPDLLDRPACRVPLEAITKLRARLGDDAAVCGKVFGPWTLAYHMFGVEAFLIGTIDDPDQPRRILELLMPVTIQFGRAQVAAGADCLLLADHATRDLCSPDAYRDFLMSLHSRLVEELPVPLVLHICGNTSDRIGMIDETHLACFHYDTTTGPPADVRALAGQRLALMGGISNYQLLAGTPEQITASAAEAIAGGIDIIGPECAIPLGVPLANLLAITAAGNSFGS